MKFYENFFHKDKHYLRPPQRHCSTTLPGHVAVSGCARTYKTLVIAVLFRRPIVHTYIRNMLQSEIYITTIIEYQLVTDRYQEVQRTL